MNHAEIETLLEKVTGERDALVIYTAELRRLVGEMVQRLADDDYVNGYGRDLRDHDALLTLKILCADDAPGVPT